MTLGSFRKRIGLPSGPLKLKLCDDKANGHHVHAIDKDSVLHSCMGEMDIGFESFQRVPIVHGDVIIKVLRQC